MKTAAAWRRQLLVPVWFKLAIYGALGVVLVHSVHIVFGNAITTNSLMRLQASQGLALADSLARPLAEAQLVGDRLRVEELLQATVSSELVSWCLVEKQGKVLAQAAKLELPATLLASRPPGDNQPLQYKHHRNWYLEVARPILGGSLGRIRIGLSLSAVAGARKRVAVTLGLVASAVLLLGLAAALVVGRRITGPVREMLAAAESFDAAEEPPPLPSTSRDEIGLLARKFEQMMGRLHNAYLEGQRFLKQQMETERLAALGTLVAGLAHEINNPLAGMKNCLHRLRTGELDEQRRQRYLQLMAQGIDRVEALIKQLLDFARPARLQVTRLAPRRLLEEASALVQALLDKQRIRLQLRCPEPMPVIEGDRRQLEQALVNLLLNAAYVTPAGESIELEAVADGHWLQVTVTDRGPGIPREFLGKVTEPFFTTKPPGEGTGLGLSVTASIVQAHGGRLEFELPPVGTRAKILLPLPARPAGTRAQESA